MDHTLVRLKSEVMRLSVHYQTFDLSYRAVSLPPLDVQRHRVLGVEAVIIPPGDQPHIAVVSLLPAWPLNSASVLAVEAGTPEDGAREMRGDCDPVEDVEQVPVNDRVQIWQVWVVEASIALLLQDTLELPAEDEGRDVGDGDGLVPDRGAGLQGVGDVSGGSGVSVGAGGGPVVCHQGHQRRHSQPLAERAACVQV